MLWLLGSPMNAIRGGQIIWKNGPSWLPRRDRIPNDPVNAGVFALVTWMLSGNLLLAVAAFCFMWLGASFGWGAYIGAIRGDSKPEKEVSFIDKIITPLESLPRLWGVAGLTLRGMLWGACIAVPFFMLYPPAALGFVLCGSLMGVVYAWVIYGVQLVSEDHKIYGVSSWAISEWLFGAVLWSSLHLV